MQSKHFHANIKRIVNDHLKTFLVDSVFSRPVNRDEITTKPFKILIKVQCKEPIKFGSIALKSTSCTSVMPKLNVLMMTSTTDQ